MMETLKTSSKGINGGEGRFLAAEAAARFVFLLVGPAGFVVEM